MNIKGIKSFQRKHNGTCIMLESTVGRKFHEIRMYNIQFLKIKSCFKLGCSIYKISKFGKICML